MISICLSWWTDRCPLSFSYALRTSTTTCSHLFGPFLHVGVVKFLGEGPFRSCLLYGWVAVVHFEVILLRHCCSPITRGCLHVFFNIVLSKVMFVGRAHNDYYDCAIFYSIVPSKVIQSSHSTEFYHCFNMKNYCLFCTCLVGTNKTTHYHKQNKNVDYFV